MASSSLISDLRAALGDGSRVSTAVAIREQHGRDESYHPPCPPDVVVFARSTEEVSAIVQVCARHRAPVVPFGAGTSLEGHVTAPRGGVSIDISGLNAILRVNAEDMDATVQAGVTRQQLNAHLRDSGLFFTVDPGADATLGGMAATRASGTNAVRYGTMRENVLAMTVVLADGRTIRTAKRARKSAAGYDLTRLFIGSEGTLGIITELTVKLHGIPESILSAVCAFPTIDSAINTVVQTIQCGVPVARIELLDDVEMDAVNRYFGLSYRVAPTLFLEFHGTNASAREQVKAFEAVAGEFGGAALQWAESSEERNRLWKARHDVLYANLALRSGSKAWATDVCVPISRLAECISRTKEDISGALFPIALVGHVGDGNFHLAMMIDPRRPEELAAAKALNDRLIHRALAMDGTCTGEHGIGAAKIDYLVAEHGDAVGVMRLIKDALDPDGILNPGKVLPD